MTTDSRPTPDTPVTPLVRHYRLAQRELEAWAAHTGESPTPALLDFHVAGQLYDTTFARLRAMPAPQSRPYLLAVLSSIRHPQLRIEGTGPWTFTEVEDCADGQRLCHCVNDACPQFGAAAGGRVITMREMMTEDYFQVAPYHVVDVYALVEILTGEMIDEWEYGLYRAIGDAAMLAMSSPLSLSRPPASSESPS